MYIIDGLEITLYGLKKFIKSHELGEYRAKRSLAYLSAHVAAANEKRKRVLCAEALLDIKEQVRSHVSKEDILTYIQKKYDDTMTLSGLKSIMKREGIKYHDKVTAEELLEKYMLAKKANPRMGFELLAAYIRSVSP